MATARQHRNKWLAVKNLRKKVKPGCYEFHSNLVDFFDEDTFMESFIDPLDALNRWMQELNIKPEYNNKNELIDFWNDATSKGTEDSASYFIKINNGHW